jgi:hypothetical protein
MKPLYAEAVCRSTSVGKDRLREWLRGGFLAAREGADGAKWREFTFREVVQIAILKELTDYNFPVGSVAAAAREIAEVGSLWADKVLAGKEVPDAYILWMPLPGGKVRVDHRSHSARANDLAREWLAEMPLARSKGLFLINVTQIARDVKTALGEGGFL